MSECDEIARQIVWDTLPVDATLHTRERVGKAIATALRTEREKVAEWKKRAQHAEAEAMTLRDFERARNTVSRQSKAEAEL